MKSRCRLFVGAALALLLGTVACANSAAPVATTPTSTAPPPKAVTAMPSATAQPTTVVPLATAQPTAPRTPTATPVAAPPATPTGTDRPLPSPSPLPPSTPAGSPVTRHTATPATGNVGYLEGHASIGPLTPVERVGVPTPTPSPAVCTSRGLSIYQADGATPVTSFDLQSDCDYRVALPPGTYVVKLKQQSGIGGSKDLPKTVAIESGKTTRLDFSVDTGIR